MNLNTSSSSSTASGTLTLGAGTNIINVGAINIGAARNTCTVQFPGVAGAGLRLRGVGGTDADLATMTLGNHNNSGGSGSGSTGNLSLNGFPVDIKLSTLTVGRQSNGSATGVDTGNGNLSIDTGVLSASNIVMALTTTTSVNGVAKGTINIGVNGVPAVLTVGSGGISLVNQASASSPGNIGNLNLNGGTLNCAGNLIKTTTAGTGNMTLTGSTLNMTGGGASLIGTGTAPIDNFSVADSTLNLPVVSGQASATVSTLTPGGTTNMINITSLPGVATYPSQFPVIAYSSLAGTLNFGLGTLPGTYQGYLSNNVSSVDVVITGSLIKTDTWRGNVNGNWDTTTLNWNSSGNPTNYQQGDFVSFDDTLTGTPNVALTLNVAPGALGFNNSSHNYVLSGAFKITGTTGLTKQGSGSLTLSESGGDDFTGGIVVSGGTLILDNAGSLIAGGLTIDSGTGQIGNNDANGALPSGAITLNDSGTLAFNRTDAVTVSTAIAGTGNLTQNGSGTLNLTSANAYTGNTTIGNGTLALSGSGSIATSAAVAVNNATLDVSAASPPASLTSLTLNNGTVTLAANASGIANITASSLTFAGAANHVNVSSLPPIASYPVTLTIIQSAAPASGTFNVSLGTLPAGYAGNVSQSADHTAVLLTITSGPIGVRASVLWSGADVPNLNTNWSDRLNWLLPGAPTASDNVIFNSTAAQSASMLSIAGGGAGALMPENINNIVEGNYSIASLTYTNLAGTYHNTYIVDNAALTVTNALTVGSLNVDFGANNLEYVNIAGPKGTVNVNNPGGVVAVALTSASSGTHVATMDMSALGTFQASVSRLAIGSLNTTSTRPSGTAYLAQTNVLTLSYTNAPGFTAQSDLRGLGIGNQADATHESFLYLGQNNVINVNSVGIGCGKQSGELQFNPNLTAANANPTVYFRASDGVSPVAWWTMGDALGQTGASSAPNGTADFSGGTVNALVGTMYVGRAPDGNNSGGTQCAGTLTFDNGIFNVRQVIAGYQPRAIGDAGVGTLNVSSNSTLSAGATLVISSNLTLGLATGGTGAANTAGTLNLTNGTVLAYSITPGTGSHSTITLAGGRLVVTNSIGSSTMLLETLNLAPLGTADNSTTVLSLPVRTDNAGITVGTLNLDGLDTTTNIINVESVGPVGATPVELPLIRYTTMNVLGGVFNVGLGTLPSGYAGSLLNDTANSMIALVLSSAIHPKPVITSLSVSGGNLVVRGSNGFGNVPYAVVASTDVGVPLASWASVASGIFAADGSFSFTVPFSTATPEQFFRVRVP
jgi:autotransporter-associated beta strand protein